MGPNSIHRPIWEHHPKCKLCAVCHTQASHWNLGQNLIKRSWWHHTTTWTDVSDLVGNWERWERKWGWWHHSSYRPQPGWRPLPAAAAAGSDCTLGEGCGRSALWEPKDKTQSQKIHRGASSLDSQQRSMQLQQLTIAWTVHEREYRLFN